MLPSWRKTLSPPALPSDSLLMALSLGSLCLGVSRLHFSPLLRTSFRWPRLTFCTVGQPLPSSMGRSQSRVIGEVVAPVALLSGIALSPENTVRYGRHRRKAVISLRSPSLVLLVLGLPLLPPLSTVSSGGYDIANALFCHSSRGPPAKPLFPYDRPALPVMAVCVAGWVGCRVFMLPPLTPRGYATLLVRCSGGHMESSLGRHTPTKCWLGLRISLWGFDCPSSGP